MSPCKKLHSFADGELPPGDRPAFHGHLATCRSCQDELESVMMLDALAGTLRAERRTRVYSALKSWND